MQDEQATYIAGGNIAPCIMVKPSTAADNTVLLAGVGADPCGVSQEGLERTPGLAGSDTTIAASTGNPLRVYGIGEKCLLTTGAAVTRGDWLKPDASGFGITASANDIAGARALKSAAGANVKIPVVVVRTKV